MTEITVATVGLEEELVRVRKEKDQLDQGCSRFLESNRKIGEELKAKNQELADKTRLVVCIKNTLFLEPISNFFFVLVVVLKVHTKKHLEDLVKDWDSWKNRCL